MQRSTNLTIEEVEKLKAVVYASGMTPSSPTNEHEVLRIVQGKISLIVYKLGKLVYEDNPETLKIVDQVLASQKQENNYSYEMGSDEAGKGEWYGPLVIVCISVKPSDINELRKMGVKDSKSLSKRGIKIIANEIKTNAPVVWKRTLLTPADYNFKMQQLKAEGKNLNDLLAWAHSTAIRETIDGLGQDVISSAIRITVDEFDKEKLSLNLEGLEEKGVTIIQKIGGEEEIPVAAASILAKSFFEEEVDNMCQTYGIDFRIAKPTEIPRQILGLVAKIHFRNVAR